MLPEDKIENEVEEAIGDLYLNFYRMRVAGQYQREYDTMGTIIDMLAQDRQLIREKYGVIS